jgi:UDP-N-acetyl-D-mannosaminuronic acid dehydrogenase
MVQKKHRTAARTGRSVPSCDIAVLGGCGHVGLPLGIAFSEAGRRVVLIDTSPERVASVRQGEMPFIERGGREALGRVLAAGILTATGDQDRIRDAETVIVTVGTPVDEFLDPEVRDFDGVMRKVLGRMRHGQLLVLRSTVFPGVTDRLARMIRSTGKRIDLAYCPERIAQGYALEELKNLPQIVAGSTIERGGKNRAERRAAALFAALGVEIVRLTPIEAELAKLFTNAYRYIHFAIANQFYMMAGRFGADFGRIHKAVTKNYPRMAGFSRSGFAAGPCLLKDTLQLAAFNHNSFPLGQAAMTVNEGLPSFIVRRLREARNLSKDTVGILGMAFKGDIDDRRSSLSYKLRKVLSLECKEVLCTDPYICEPGFLPLKDVLARADVLILGACHKEYKRLRTRKPLIDVFYFTERAP